MFVMQIISAIALISIKYDSIFILRFYHNKKRYAKFC